MSTILPEETLAVPGPRRIEIMLAVSAARILQRLRPEKLRKILELTSSHARPASEAEVARTRDELLSTSAECRGSSACLTRSIALVLLCRRKGTWPTWSVGVVTSPPFAAHAWVEVDGKIIGEPIASDSYRAFYKVTCPPGSKSH